MSSRGFNNWFGINKNKQKIKTPFNQSIDLYSIPGLVTEKQLEVHIWLLVNEFNLKKKNG